MRWRLPDRGQRHAQIVGTIVMIFDAAKTLIARPVATGDHRVMNAGRIIMRDGDDGTSPVADQRVTNCRHDAFKFGMTMRHRQELEEIVGAEGPEIANLGPMRVDHTE